MSYIKVLPQNNLTSAQRAEAISYELWAISRPLQVRNPDEVTSYMFGWVKHPTQDPNYEVVVDTALQVDPDYIIKVHPENNLNALVNLFPELTETERAQLVGFIQSQQAFPFQYIVPSTSKIFTHEEMVSAGWFSDQSEIV
jgi:hypothetical protein